MEFIVCIRRHYRKLFATDPFPTCFSSYVVEFGNGTLIAMRGTTNRLMGGKRMGNSAIKLMTLLCDTPRSLV